MALDSQQGSRDLNNLGAKSELLTTEQSTSDVFLQLSADDRNLSALDHGKEAWLFLASATILEALIWGFPSVFGVFQAFYTSHPPFEGSEGIPIVGTCAMGIMYLEMPLIYIINKAWPNLRRSMSVCGIVVVCLALGLGSLSVTVPQLIASQGVLYAIGGGFAWTPLLQYMPEWFDEKLSLAYGIVLVSISGKPIETKT